LVMPRLPNSHKTGNAGGLGEEDRPGPVLRRENFDHDHIILEAGRAAKFPMLRLKFLDDAPALSANLLLCEGWGGGEDEACDSKT